MTVSKPTPTLKKPSATDAQRETHRLNIAAGNYTRQELIESRLWPLRFTHARIHSVQELKETLRAGQTTDVGGYPLYLVTADSEPLSFQAARECFREIVSAMNNTHGTPMWRVAACEVNWEDQHLYCSHTSERIEPAYERDEEE